MLLVYYVLCVLYGMGIYGDGYTRLRHDRKEGLECLQVKMLGRDPYDDGRRAEIFPRGNFSNSRKRELYR